MPNWLQAPQIIPREQDPTGPGIVLRLEGFAMLVVALLLYLESGQSWWLFVVLFLLPDLSILAYFATPRIGAVAYNVAHTYVLPAAVFALGFIGERGFMMGVGLIWAAHIGCDRLLGFGLKYPTAFKDTHLQRVV